MGSVDVCQEMYLETRVIGEIECSNLGLNKEIMCVQ